MRDSKEWKFITAFKNNILHGRGESYALVGPAFDILRNCAEAAVNSYGKDIVTIDLGAARDGLRAAVFDGIVQVLFARNNGSLDKRKLHLSVTEKGDWSIAYL